MSSYLSGLRPKTIKSALQESEASLDMADRPQQALTGLLAEGFEGAGKGFRGEKKYQGLDDIVKAYGFNVPDELGYEFVSLAYDVLADPTNVMGGAMIKGFNLMDIGANKARGMFTGSSPNVIKNFYSLDPSKAFPAGYNPDKVQKALAAGEEVPEQAKNAYGVWSTTKMITDKMGTTFEALPSEYQQKIMEVASKLPSSAKNTVAKLRDNFDDPDVKKKADQVLAAAFKGAGFVEWAGKSASNVFSTLFDASSRQAYRDTGLTTANQKRVSEAFSEGTGKGIKTGIAQLQHAAYMAFRRGRKDLPPALQETMDQMSIGGFQKLDPDKYGELSNTVEKTVRGEVYQTPPEVTSSLFNQAMKNWGVGFSDDATMVVRQTRGYSGDFVSDANRKSKPVIAGRRIFKSNPKGFNSVVDLKKAFEAQGFKADDIKMTPDGVIITNSAASYSYLEGGINLVTHINLKGVANVVVSDMYDFLEKVPVVRKIEEMMDEDIIGVSPPITVDLLKGTPSAVNKRTVEENVGKLAELTQEAGAFTNARGVAQERQDMTAIFGAGMLARENNDEQ